MAHFRGTVTGNRSTASRLGTKRSGLTVEAAGWAGKITVEVTEHDGVDGYIIRLEPHMGSGGVSRLITSGILDARRPS